QERRKLEDPGCKGARSRMPRRLCFSIEQLRIVLAKHPCTGAGRHDYIGIVFECRDDLLSDLFRGLAVSRIESGLSTARLRGGYRNIAASLLKELHGSKAGGRPEHVDQA